MTHGRGRRVVLAGCLAAAAMVMSGCSSGAGSTPPTRSPVSSYGQQTASSSAAPSGQATTSQPTMSTGSFVRTANAMCLAQSRAERAAVAAISGIATLPSFADTYRDILTTYYQRFAKLVIAQPAHVVLFARWLTPRHVDYLRVIAALAAVKRAAAAGDAAAAQTALARLTKLPNHDAAVNPFLRSYGLTACA